MQVSYGFTFGLIWDKSHEAPNIGDSTIKVMIKKISLLFLLLLSSNQYQQKMCFTTNHLDIHQQECDINQQK